MEDTGKFAGIYECYIFLKQKNTEVLIAGTIPQ
jgi:hypothetical protein